MNKRLVAAVFAVASVGAAHAGMFYDSLLNYSGSYFAPGGATGGSSAITNMIFDDFAVPVQDQGKALSKVNFVIINANSAAIAFRLRFRFYKDDNGGKPGTYINGFSPAYDNIAGLSAYNLSLTGLGAVTLPAGSSKLWMGVTFDANFTTTTVAPKATAAQLNQLGWGLSSSANLGTNSATEAWLSNAPGSYTSSNPACSALGFSNAPSVFSFRVESVPEPSTWLALGLGATVILRRRKK